ncbi:MAG TPA: hypothetical protein VGK29_11555 [Paludibaculum sp.]|jgi:hypothetical protein
MGLTLDQIVARLEDPEVPVVWLDPITPDEIWNDLPAALAERGLAVLSLDGGQAIVDHDTLLARFSEVLPELREVPANLTQLKECLLRLPHQTSRGWVVMFHKPESLRQNDEATFEDFLEVLEAVHGSECAGRARSFKLVVRD